MICMKSLSVPSSLRFSYLNSLNLSLIYFFPIFFLIKNTLLFSDRDNSLRGFICRSRREQVFNFLHIRGKARFSLLKSPSGSSSFTLHFLPIFHPLKILRNLVFFPLRKEKIFLSLSQQKKVFIFYSSPPPCWFVSEIICHPRKPRIRYL